MVFLIRTVLRSTKKGTASADAFFLYPIDPWDVQHSLSFYHVLAWWCLMPIGSMYGIYVSIGGILMVNVTIYSIHGPYGIVGAWD